MDSEKKTISVRVNKKKYEKVIEHIKTMNKKYKWDKLTFGEIVDKALDNYIKTFILK